MGILHGEDAAGQQICAHLSLREALMEPIPNPGECHCAARSVSRGRARLPAGITVVHVPAGARCDRASGAAVRGLSRTDDVHGVRRDSGVYLHGTSRARTGQVRICHRGLARGAGACACGRRVGASLVAAWVTDGLYPRVVSSLLSAAGTQPSPRRYARAACSRRAPGGSRFSR